MVSIITPAILMIRIERLINNISVDDNQNIIKLCRRYIEDFENKKISVSITSQNDTRFIAEDFFEIELLVTMGAMTSAINKLEKLHHKIIKILVNYSIFCNRIMNDKSNEDTIGTLSILPTDCLRDIVDKLQIDYVW